tara:strand:- start:182 stop:1141 length:960 start_codon:yes stop_codon:yes gene_type:complete
MRFKNIDLLKGLLIIIVILGHVLQGTLNESIWRTIIYSFHMPLFIGISGFLFNLEKTITYNLIELIKKYFLRIILPWTFAVLVYFLLSIIQNGSSNTLIELIKAFISPFYHLWFIPGFLSWVILTWILKKIKLSNKLLLATGLSISLVSIILKYCPELYKDLVTTSSIIELILHTFRPYFYFFFVLGIIYKKIELKKPMILEYVFTFICVLFVIYIFYTPNKFLSIITFFLFNSLLLSVAIKLSSNNMILGNKTIEWLGLNSLSIYLWHVIPILICRLIIGTENLGLFYLGTICLELVFIFVYKYLLKINVLKNYVFGM